jgi:hypothetical protein
MMSGLKGRSNIAQVAGLGNRPRHIFVLIEAL